MKKKIIIISGDPNSINSELIYKSWKKIDKSLKKRIYFISNFYLLHKQFKKLNYLIKLTKVKNIYEDVKNDSLKIININLKFKNPFKVTENSSSRFVIKSLETKLFFFESHEFFLPIKFDTRKQVAVKLIDI